MKLFMVHWGTWGIIYMCAKEHENSKCSHAKTVYTMQLYKVFGQIITQKLFVLDGIFPLNKNLQIKSTFIYAGTKAIT